MSFQLRGWHRVSITDPGVAVLPAVQRPLPLLLLLLVLVLALVQAGSTATGGLLAEPVVQNLGANWFCEAASLRCNASTALSTLRTAAPVLLAPTSSAALAQPIRLQASATATPLADGVVLNSGALLLSGSLRVDATFNTPFELTRQPWDVVATAEPALGRALAGPASDDINRSDRAAELAVLRLVLGGADDSSFAAGSAHQRQCNQTAGPRGGRAGGMGNPPGPLQPGSPRAIGSAGSRTHSDIEPSYTATSGCPIRTSASASMVAAMPPPQ